MSRIQHGQKDHEKHQQQIRPQLPGIRKGKIGRFKERLPAGKEPEGAIGNDTGNRCGHDHFRLELRRAVEHFRGKQGAGQRGAEDRGNSGAHSRRHENAAVFAAEFQQVCQERSETGADLRDRPFAASRSAAADRQCTGYDFHQGHPRADLPLMIVVSGDDGIRPMALRLGGKGINQPAAEDASDRGNDEQEPGTKGLVPGSEPWRIHLARRPHRRVIPGQFTECIMLYTPRGHIKENRPESRNDTHQHRQPKQPDLTTHPPLTQEQELGKPSPQTGRTRMLA